ncbi:hypothetical protein ACMX25_32100 [Caballeronia sp. 15715]|uniref:hypothetical protein n=1 Tax=Caballeronia sp. 15715 TaxID=3391030 RepID=UPI0039E5985E
MNDFNARRKVLGCLVAGCIAPLVSACGGGGTDSSGAAVDGAEANAQKAATGSTTAFAVTSPAQNASATSTFTVSGTAGTQWVNVAVYSGSTKLSSDVTPSGGKWSASVKMGTLTGAQTLTVMAFSVAAGKAGGTSTSASLKVAVGAAAPATPAVGVLPYYGIGAHYNQGGLFQSIPLAQQVALMTANGMKTCRQDCWDQSSMNVLANTVIPGMKGVTVLPCLAATPTGSSVTSAYTQGYQLGIAAANTLAGLVPVIEMGNELDEICVNNNVDGNLPSHYNSTAPLYVAFQAGLCNGFRSVDTTGKTKVMLGGIAYIHFGFLQMIVSNIQPNGSAMPTAAANFDMIAWHYYYTGGNMESVYGKSGTYNVFTSIAKISTKPLYFSECGIGQPSNSISASTGVAYIKQAMAQMVAQPQVVGFNFYEMYDFTDGYGLYNNNSVAYGWQSTLASFIAANPKA